MAGDSRYEVLPCGLGSHGVYDNQERRWVRADTGPQSRHDADVKLRQIRLRQERPEPQRTTRGRSR